MGPSDAPAAPPPHLGGGQAKGASAKHLLEPHLQQGPHLQQEQQKAAESAGEGVKLGTQFTCFTGTKVQILTPRKVKVSRLWVEKYRPTKVSEIAGHKTQVYITLRHTRRRIRLN